MPKKCRELYEYREMIYSMVRRDLRGRYKSSVLGFLWTFINPLCQIMIYTLVFSHIFRMGVERYYLFLTVVMVPWVFFSTSVTGGAVSIINQQDLVKKIYFPRQVLPISYVTSAFVNMLLTFLVIFAVLIVSGFGIKISILWALPIVMIVEYALAVGITMLTSALTVYFRDLEHILGILSMAWMYLTPILYEVTVIPEQYRSLIYMNPMTGIILC